jgi:hypothetical protein
MKGISRMRIATVRRTGAGYQRAFRPLVTTG